MCHLKLRQNNTRVIPVKSLAFNKQIFQLDNLTFVSIGTVCQRNITHPQDMAIICRRRMLASPIIGESSVLSVQSLAKMGSRPKDTASTMSAG